MQRVLLSIALAMLVGIGGVFTVQFFVDEPLMGPPPAPPAAPPVPEGAAAAETEPAAATTDEDAETEPADEQEAPRYALAPPSEGAYLGAYAPDLLEPGGIEDWNERSGAELAIAHWYQGWGDDRNELYPGWLERAREQGTVPMISWEPWGKPEGEFTDPDQPEFRLARIADGAYDDYIREWAEVAAEDGGPLLVRFAHEMNGYWYPWSVAENDNTPEDYVRAWRHVHDLVAEAGADNIRWVWAVNTVEGLAPELRDLDFAEFYPGDDYVDWVSFVGFNYGTASEWSVWRAPDVIYAETYERLEAFDKPVMLSETGTVPQGGDPGAWVESALGTLEENYPGLDAVVWFDAPRAEHIDFRLRDEALERFREHVDGHSHWQARPELVELPARAD